MTALENREQRAVSRRAAVARRIRACQASEDVAKWPAAHHLGRIVGSNAPVNKRLYRLRRRQRVEPAITGLQTRRGIDAADCEDPR